ncbi:hypothetical protein [Arthrobacter sp. AFG20]|uniref:hypothetical protein n=1 Tax=Arthrobacter sp. AFG20 TaxID=1688671 RepID=UPI0011AF83F5|nr:hypothetical protein [Arthrobacter sp. AFG20]
MSTGLHVIFGTGAIGLATFDALRHRGQTIRLVKQQDVQASPMVPRPAVWHSRRRRKHGARLASMENVYMYGPRRTPANGNPRLQPHTKKGQLWARMSQELLAAHRAGRVQVAIGRVCDYFGPRGGTQSNLGDRVFPAALAGKPASVLGNPDQLHTYR